MISRLCETYGSPQPHPSSYVPSSSSPSSSSPRTTENEHGQQYLHSFPPPSALSHPSVSSNLRQSLGFGYRSSYVSGTAQAVSLLPPNHLQSLRPPCKPSKSTFTSSSSDPNAPTKPDNEADEFDPAEDAYEKAYQKAKEALMAFPGVGPKVADCVLLMGMGWRHIVPVDVHVFRIGVEQYGFLGGKKGGKGKYTMSKGIYDKIQVAFRERWGEWSGWAQQILFTSDLKGFEGFDWSETAALQEVVVSKVKEEEDGGGKRPLKRRREVEVETTVKEGATMKAIRKKIRADDEFAPIVETRGETKMEDLGERWRDLNDPYPTPLSLAMEKTIDLVQEDEGSLADTVKGRNRRMRMR